MSFIGLQSRAAVAVFLLEAQGRCGSLPVPTSVGFPHSLAPGPILHLHLKLLSDSDFLSFFSTIKYPCDHTGPTWVIQDIYL